MVVRSLYFCHDCPNNSLYRVGKSRIEGPTRYPSLAGNAYNRFSPNWPSIVVAADENNSIITDEICRKEKVPILMKSPSQSITFSVLWDILYR